MRRLVLALAMAGCAPSVSSPAPSPAPAPAPAAAPTGPPAAPAVPSAPQASPFPVPPGEAAFRTVRSQRFQLSIPLPDRGGWSLDKDGSSFLVMHHPATSSTLLVRRWREQTPMNRDRCEEASRLIRELPARQGELDATFVDVPPGFDTRVSVGAISTPADTRGWLLAFGAAGRRCFAFVYTTEARAPLAERRVADRLAVMQTLVLEKIEVHHDTDIEIPRRD